MAPPLVSTHSVNASLRTDRSDPTTGGGYSGITDPSKRTPLFISGWNASNLSPNPDLHAAAHSTLAPTAEQKTNLQAVTNHVLGLNDSSLASRTTGSTQPPAGAPVGSASVSSGGSIPSVIQNAVNNLQSNTQAASTATNSNSIAGILQKVLGSLGGGGGTNPQQVTQDALAQHAAAIQNYTANVNTPTGQAYQPQASPAYTDPALSYWQNTTNNYLAGKTQNAYSAAQPPGAAPVPTPMNPMGGAPASSGWTPYMPTF